MAHLQNYPLETPKKRIKLRLQAYRDYDGRWIGMWDVIDIDKEQLVWKIWDA